MKRRSIGAGNLLFDVFVYLVMFFVLFCCLVPFLYMLGGFLFRPETAGQRRSVSLAQRVYAGFL